MPRTSGDDALIPAPVWARYTIIKVGQTAAIDALKVEDVAEAAEQLAWARSLSDLFPPGDLDLPDAA